MGADRSMLDLDGWAPVSCGESDRVRELVIRKTDGMAVLSSLTDPDGERSGLHVIYTEWGVDGVPLLRDYNWSDGRGCRHYVPEDGA